MNKIFRFLSVLAVLIITNAALVFASDNPVKWSSEVNDLGDGLYEVVFTAQMPEPWHLYDLGPYDDFGPNPTVFTFETSAGLSLQGDVYYITEPEKEYDDVFMTEIGFFEHTAQFGQKVKLSGSGGTLSANIEWMVCDDMQCLPLEDIDMTVEIGMQDDSSVFAVPGNPVSWTTEIRDLGKNKYEVIFSADIPGDWHLYDLGPYEEFGPNPTVFVFSTTKGLELEGEVYYITEPVREYDDVYMTEIGSFEHKARFGQKVILTAKSGILTANVEWMVCDDTQCLPLEDIDITVGIPDNDAIASADGGGVSTGTNETGSLWSILISAVLFGFAALLTPCVFPMIPMTVTFFLKGSENKAAGRFRAGMYGFFIILLYTVPIGAIIFITWLIGGDAVTADIFNWLATHWIPNLIFFAVFMIFAASFLGAFEIVLPNWMVNKSSNKSGKSGLGGVFFMALTLVLVSFSCTGPIVGAVLIQSTSGEVWTPIVTMLFFSIAFALPFTLFALFPSWLKKLPKSGGWLNSVKVVLGFIELALGLKFLSVADQTYHWGILDREIYLALWIVIFTLMGFYLLGKLKFKHDSDTPYISVTRLVLAVFTFSFVVYLVPGMWGAPLKGLSGYMPPMHTQDFVLGSGGGVGYTDQKSIEEEIKYADFLHLPHNLEGFFDYEQGLNYSRKVNKPLFIDFTGHGCVNCREMESKVWSDPTVLSMLRNDFVIVALYSDDKKELPQSEWVTTSSGKVLKGLGKINSNFAKEKFGANAQPYYIITDNEGNQLVPAKGYDTNIQNYIDFLRSGIEAYNNAK